MITGGLGVWSFSFSHSVSSPAHLTLLFLLSASIKVVILPLSGLNVKGQAGDQAGN